MSTADDRRTTTIFERAETLGIQSPEGSLAGTDWKAEAAGNADPGLRFAWPIDPMATPQRSEVGLPRRRRRR